MTIAAGERVPEVTLYEMTGEGPAPISSTEIFGGKKIALFGVPGAFTPTCHKSHMPSFVNTADQLRAKGVDEIICMTVNDPFVAAEWGKVTGADQAGIRIVCDSLAEFARATALDFDASARGLGVRCRRFSALVDDGEIKVIKIDASPGEAIRSVGEVLLDQI